jgi:hypothetical protein
MANPARKDPRWKLIVVNAHAIRGALAECLRLSDEITDSGVKREAMRFIHAMEYLATAVVGNRGRFATTRAPQRELVERLREEIAHIGHLLAYNDRVFHEMGDSEATNLTVRSIEVLNQFAGLLRRSAI